MPLIVWCMGSRLVAILTDFGVRDYYVGAMKGVIKTLCPGAELVDISHEVEKWSVLDASYVLSCCYDDFPPETVFLVVVDPGVGTSRRAVAVKTRRYYMVGPDNGVLYPAAVSDTPFEAREIVNPAFKWWKESSTFHGRNLFAPAAARLACGASFTAVGPRVDLLELEEARAVVSRGVVEGTVVHVDWFGNVATNIGEKELGELGVGFGDKIRVEWGGGTAVLPLAPSFGYVEPGAALAEINSCGRLEIAVNRGNASERLGLKVGDKIRVSRA